MRRADRAARVPSRRTGGTGETARLLVRRVATGHRAAPGLLSRRGSARGRLACAGLARSGTARTGLGTSARCAHGAGRAGSRLARGLEAAAGLTRGPAGGRAGLRLTGTGGTAGGPPGRAGRGLAGAGDLTGGADDAGGAGHRPGTAGDRRGTHTFATRHHGRYDRRGADRAGGLTGSGRIRRTAAGTRPTPAGAGLVLGIRGTVLAGIRTTVPAPALGGTRVGPCMRSSTGVASAEGVPVAPGDGGHRTARSARLTTGDETADLAGSGVATGRLGRCVTPADGAGLVRRGVTAPGRGSIRSHLLGLVRRGPTATGGLCRVSALRLCGLDFGFLMPGGAAGR